MQFSYRNSVVQNSNLIIVAVKFKLTKTNSNQIEFLQNEYLQKRLTSQPYAEPSLGSVFKRKDGYEPISKLIETLGLKGYSIGGAVISQKHAGFIINKQSATCQDVLKLIEYIQNKIKQVYGFVPELEIKVLGD